MGRTCDKCKDLILDGAPAEYPVAIPQTPKGAPSARFDLCEEHLRDLQLWFVPGFSIKRDAAARENSDRQLRAARLELRETQLRATALERELAAARAPATLPAASDAAVSDDEAFRETTRETEPPQGYDPNVGRTPNQHEHWLLPMLQGLPRFEATSSVFEPEPEGPAMSSPLSFTHTGKSDG